MLKSVRHRSGSAQDHPTRKRLVDATATHIRETRTDDVDLDAILKEVGVTKGSLYHHFSSVNDLIIAALLEIFSSGVAETIQWFSSMREECSTADDVRERIRFIMQQTQAPERVWVRAQRARILSLSATNPDLGEKVAAMQKQLTDAGTEVMADFQSRSWLREDIDPRALAVFMQAFTLGRIVDDVLDDAHQMDPDAWTNLVNAWADAFFVPGRPSTSGQRKRTPKES